MSQGSCGGCQCRATATWYDGSAPSVLESGQADGRSRVCPGSGAWDPVAQAETVGPSGSGTRLPTRPSDGPDPQPHQPHQSRPFPQAGICPHEDFT
jgi:hypothetical protein